MKRFPWLATIAALASASGFAADIKDIRPTRLDGAPLWPVHSFAPAQGHKIDGLVIIISDRQGWDERATAIARHLADAGDVVIGLDLPVYSAALKKEMYDCSTVNRELEVLTRDVEKNLPFSEFRPPVILGIGAGSGIVYAAVGQVLPNTFAGGIGLGFTPEIDVGHKLCLTLDPTPSGAPLRYAPFVDRETPFVLTPAPDFANDAAAFAAKMAQGRVISAEGGDLAAVDEAIRQVPRVGKPESSVDGLPLVELPPTLTAAQPPPTPPTGPRPANPVVIFYSGDGGWRDIDKQIGGALSSQGYFVVGVDSLRYFWRKKPPHEMAIDLARLARHYNAKLGDHGIILVGYSFGADLIPFIVNRLPADIKSDIKQISLLGVSEHASFEIRLQGILGGSNTDGPATLPELEKLKGIRVQCVFGFDERDSVCAEKSLDGIVIRDEMKGGHHFNGDYGDIANFIVAADKARTEQPK